MKLGLNQLVNHCFANGKMIKFQIQIACPFKILLSEKYIKFKYRGHVKPFDVKGFTFQLILFACYPDRKGKQHLFQRHPFQFQSNYVLIYFYHFIRGVLFIIQMQSQTNPLLFKELSILFFFYLQMPNLKLCLHH